jgi:hypothetical protein
VDPAQCWDPSGFWQGMDPFNPCKPGANQGLRGGGFEGQRSWLGMNLECGCRPAQPMVWGSWWCMDLARGWSPACPEGLVEARSGDLAGWFFFYYIVVWRSLPQCKDLECCIFGSPLCFTSAKCVSSVSAGSLVQELMRSAVLSLLPFSGPAQNFISKCKVEINESNKASTCLKLRWAFLMCVCTYFQVIYK